MRARMQAQPHPSQFLSLRESGLRVNAVGAAVPNRIEFAPGNPDGTDIYLISSLTALTAPISGATLKPRYPIWSPTPSRGFVRQARASARLCPGPSKIPSLPRPHLLFDKNTRICVCRAVLALSTLSPHLICQPLSRLQVQPALSTGALVIPLQPADGEAIETIEDCSGDHAQPGAPVWDSR